MCCSVPISTPIFSSMQTDLAHTDGYRVLMSGHAIARIRLHSLLSKTTFGRPRIPFSATASRPPHASPSDRGRAMVADHPSPHRPRNGPPGRGLRGGTERLGMRGVAKVVRDRVSLLGSGEREHAPSQLALLLHLDRKIAVR